MYIYLSIYLCVFAYLHIFLCVLCVDITRVFKRVIKQINKNKNKKTELNLAPNESLKNKSNGIEEFLKDAPEKIFLQYKVMTLCT